MSPKRQLIADYIVIQVSILLALRLLKFTSLFAVNVFYRDEWIYFAPLFDGKSVWALLPTRWDIHFLGIGLIPAAWVLELTHWSSRALCFFMASLLIVLMAVGLFIKRKMFGPFALWDCLIPVFFVSVLQLDTVTDVSNPGLILPLIFFFLMMYAYLRESGAIRYGAMTLLAIVSIFTYIGYLNAVVMLCFLFTEALQHYRLRGKIARTPVIAAIAMIVGVAVVIATYHRGQYLPKVPPFNCAFLSGVFLFSCALLARNVGMDFHFLGQLFPRFHLTIAYSAGAFLLLTIAALAYATGRKVLKKGVRSAPRETMIFSCLLHGLFFCASVSWARYPYGMDASQWPRYYTSLIPCFFGVYLALSARLSHAARNVIFTGFFLFFGAANVPWPASHEILGTASNLAKKTWVDCYMQHGDVNLCNEASGLELCYSREKLEKELAFLKERRLNLFADR